MTTHPITKYCKREKLSQAEVAVRAGISKGYLCRIISGQIQCGAVAAMKLHRATKGRASIHDLITWKERVEKRARRAQKAA